MGMFSRIIYEGKELQFKYGWDQCQTYAVGDRIDWTPDPFWPGSHIDGVLDAEGDTTAAWVVIKDCTIVAVEPRDSIPLNCIVGLASTTPTQACGPQSSGRPRPTATPHTRPSSRSTSRKPAATPSRSTCTKDCASAPLSINS